MYKYYLILAYIKIIMVKLQQMKQGQFMVSVPKEYVKLKGWRKGQELAMGFDHEGNIVLKEVK